MIVEILKEKIVHREYYLKKIDNFLGSNIIKVLVWQRRVGKSCILKSVIQKLAKDLPIKNFFYINKEDLTWDYIKDYKDLKQEFDKFLQTIDNNFRIFVWIDEIQEIEDWENFITHLQTKYKNIEIFITWSNSKLLSGDLATKLTGRYVEIFIYPLDLEEFAIFKDEEISKDLFLQYIQFWGLPWIFEVKYNREAIFEYLRWVYNTILLKDVVRYNKVKKIDFLDSLYKFVFANIWNIFSAKSIADYLKSQRIKISIDTVLEYLRYGINAFLIWQLKAVDPTTRKYFEIYNKYYVGDLWLRNAIVWVKLAKDINKLLENYIYLLLKKYWYDIRLGRFKIFDKEIKNYKNIEVDFIAEKEGKVMYIQVATSVLDEETRTRELRPLLFLNDNSKFVITLDDIDFGEYKGIKFVNILDFHKILKQW